MFWDFIDPFDNVEDTAQEYLWNDMDYPILVFRNGGIPAITNFGSTCSETVNVPIFKNVKVDRKLSYLKANKIPLPLEWKISKDGFTNRIDKTVVEDAIVKIKEVQTITTTVVINKARAFGETIINGKYEIIGAIVLLGTSIGKDSGVHYVSYVKTPSGEWYYFNDIGAVWKRLDEFPPLFKEEEGRKPEMYFYKKC